SVVTVADDTLVGAAELDPIDMHHRGASLGLELLPACRGRGLGADVVRVLCHYGFVVLGLHRIQVDTLTDNEAMIRIAQRVGFRREAVHRHASWVMGEFLDDLVLGLLAREWTP